MFKFRLWIFALVTVIGCKSPDHSASLHDVVTTGTTQVNVNPFPLDSLLTFSNKQLLEAFGKKNLAIRGDDGFDGDDPYLYAILFEGTDREVELVLGDSTNEGQVVSVTARKSSHWSTRDGIAPGLKLKDLEKLNGAPFFFYGGGWDQGGYVTNWNKGKLTGKVKALRLDRNYMMPYDMSKGDYDVHEFSSASSDAQSGNPVVEEVTVSRI